MNRPTNAKRRDQGVALVTTVIVVAVLAVVAAAMMQSTTVDRLSSRSALNYAQAKLAAESAFAVAERQLLTNTTNDTFIVVANNFPILLTNGSAVTVSNSRLFVGNGSVGSSDIAYVPLFSSVNSLTSSVAPILTDATPQLTLSNPALESAPTTTVFTNQMPGGFAAASPVVAWVYLTQNVTNASNQVSVVTNARFAYWVEDLGGKMDISVIGTNTTDPVARRPTGTNPAEIAFWAALTNVAAPGQSRQAGDAVIAVRSNMVSSVTTRLVASNVATNAGLVAELAANLRHDTNEPEMIPFGFRYPDEGRPKFNLNTNLTRSGVEVIASILQRNLPQFVLRAGGYTNSAGGGAANPSAFTPLSYLQTLAANIIDYADADSSATTDGTPLSTSQVRPVFRGVDSYPFVNEINKRYLVTTNAITNFSGQQGRGVFVETTDFVEVWNPSSAPSPAGNLTFLAVHGQQVNFGFLSSSFATPTWASNSSGAISNGISSNRLAVPSLKPNEFQILACPTVTNFFFIPRTNAVTAELVQERTNSRFYVGWNDVLVDAGLGGMLRNQGNLNTGSPVNRSHLPSFIYRDAAGGFGDPAAGDPRATIYLSRVLDANAYANNSTFGGRNRRSGSVASNQPYFEVAPASWPDGGHNSPPGNVAGSDAVAPTNVALAAYTNDPPGRIANRGSYSSVAELGSVFDPAQWRESALGSRQGKWTNLSTNATADNGYGGGNSLRIGRAEHPRFARDGLRAAQLMDLFAVGSTNNAGMVLNRIAGRINLNTAGNNALQALAAGVAHVSDPSLKNGGTNFFIPTNAVNLFVQGVRDFRSVKPFRAVSELPAIRASTNTNSAWPTNAVFGNSNAEAAGVQAWNDAAAEEWFLKIHALSTVRSRNFIIHSIGQSLNTNRPDQPLSSYQVSRQVYVTPMRDPTNGVITNGRVDSVQTWTH